MYKGKLMSVVFNTYYGHLAAMLAELAIRFRS